jgi:NADH:ubiquinone oxidoreductase subunit 5 (subunit L)/multisubunit Na+/H+ antiporter MnhA subunit
MNLAWLIPTLPVVAFVILIFTGFRLKNNAAYVAIAAIVGSFLVSCWVAIDYFGHTQGFQTFAPWAPFGSR